MTAPNTVHTAHERLLGPAFDTLTPGLVLIGAPSAVGKTCLSLNLAAHFVGHLREPVLYFSPGAPKEVVLARLAKNMTADGEAVDVGIVADMPLVVVDTPDPSSQSLVEVATSYVEQHGQPALVLVNDLQNLHPSKEGLSGLSAAVEILADLRAIAKLTDAPVAVFSQLTPGKEVASAVAELADRVVMLSLESETATHKQVGVAFFDPPEPETERYGLSLTRETGVMGVNS